jgi:hypothetical protein
MSVSVECGVLSVEYDSAVSGEPPPEAGGGGGGGGSSGYGTVNSGGAVSF